MTRRRQAALVAIVCGSAFARVSGAAWLPEGEGGGGAEIPAYRLGAVGARRRLVPTDLTVKHVYGACRRLSERRCRAEDRPAPAGK